MNPVLRPEMDIFQRWQTQYSMEKCRLERFRPINALNNASDLELYLPGSGDDYSWPMKHYLLLAVKVTNADGTDLADVDKTIPVNNFMHSLWKNVEVVINGTKITPSNGNYGYKAMFEKLLSYGDCALESWCEASLFVKDTAGQMNHVDDNVGGVKRRTFIAESKTVDMMGPLHIDLFQQGRLLPNGLSMSIKLSRNNTDFSLMIPDANGRKIEIVTAALMMMKVKPNASTAAAHAKVFQNDLAMYPIRRSEHKTFIISKDRQSHTIENVCSGQLPRRVVIGMVSNEAFNGHRAMNPFEFKHYKLNKIALYLDGELNPTYPLTPDFTNDLYIRSYMSLFDGTGKQNQDEGLIVSRSDYAKGYTLFVFDLSSDMSADATYCDTIKTGSFNLDFSFAEKTPETINVIVRLEFDSLVKIDRNKNVILDY